MDAEIRTRLKWVKAYDQIKSHGVAALKCGISRPTLRKWLRRYEEHGEVGLTSQSRRPKNSPARRIGDRERAWILEFRGRRLGSRRFENRRSRPHGFQVIRTPV